MHDSYKLYGFHLHLRFVTAGSLNFAHLGFRVNGILLKWDIVHMRYVTRRWGVAQNGMLRKYNVGKWVSACMDITHRKR